MTDPDDRRPRVPNELLAHLETCEHTAQAQLQRLQAMIAELSEQLEHAQQRLERLRLTRRTLLEVADPEPDRPQPGTTPIDTLPTAYQDILAAFTSSDTALRCKDLCHTLDTGTEPRHIEAMRAKLKRLVARDLLAEHQPGLFTLNHSEH
ncbi:hypothetical protein [Actinomadura sp. B10D3]|uniref:hypothetical protein n=1 Tax=Actinomadura sp. B10D3 TaxID=3153557 RepID=UPI00325F67E4